MPWPTKSTWLIIVDVVLLIVKVVWSSSEGAAVRSGATVCIFPVAVFSRTSMEILITSLRLCTIIFTCAVSPTIDLRRNGAKSLSTLGRMLVTINLSSTSRGWDCRFSYSPFKKGSAFQSSDESISSFASSSMLVLLAISRSNGGKTYLSLLTPRRSNSEAISTKTPSRALSGAFFTVFLTTWWAHKTGDFRDTTSTSRISDSTSRGANSGDEIDP